MKHVIIAVMMVAMLALVANATPPPAHGGYLGGWGMNPTNWQTATGSFSAWGIYDGTPSGGSGWVVGYDGSMNPLYITYDPILLELWIEMYCLQTYRYTSYQWHRLGNLAETINCIIEGTIQTNNGQYVSLMKDTQDLTHLWFIENIFGTAATPPSPEDIPINWYTRYGTGLVYGVGVVQNWTLTVPDPDVTILIPDPCDHWFQFKGVFEIPYHQPDGYYNLLTAGCPAPVM